MNLMMNRLLLLLLIYPSYNSGRAYPHMRTGARYQIGMEFSQSRKMEESSGNSTNAANVVEFERPENKDDETMAGQVDASGNNEVDNHDHDHDDHAHDQEEGDAHAHEEGDAHDHSSSERMSNDAVPWGAGLLAALLVNLVTFIGVLSLLPSTVLSQNVPQHIRKAFVNIIVPSFACGTLFAASIFLIIPESLHLLNGGHDDHDRRRLQNSEVDATWKFGASLMGGYLFLFCVNGTFSHHNFNEDSAPQSDPKVSDKSQSEIAEQFVDSVDALKKSVSSIQNDEHPTSDASRGDLEKQGNISAESPNEESAEVTSTEKVEDLKLKSKEEKSSNFHPDYPLILSIGIGDFFHNFADGVFIGTAFLYCRDIAILVTAGTIFHELSQELSDFLVLTNQCGLTIPMALMFNFLSGTSVMLGVIIIFLTPLSDESIGVILAMSSGVFLFLSLSQLAPRIQSSDFRIRFLSTCVWILGAIPIGLVLLNHQHC